MVAGATGVDLALLVVAADDGVMPQTREHLAIPRRSIPGIPVVTKAELAEPDWVELVAASWSGWRDRRCGLTGRSPSARSGQGSTS
jgi:selenocysteine-specific elongation factor